MAENREVKIEEVIKVTALAGAGIKTSLCREVNQYWTKEGKLIGVIDPLDKDAMSTQRTKLRNEELEQRQQELIQENRSLTHHIKILEDILEKTDLVYPVLDLDEKCAYLTEVAPTSEPFMRKEIGELAAKHIANNIRSAVKKELDND